jgi:putative ABC transport system permease protein
MNPTSMFFRLSVQHLRHQPVRAILLAIVVAVGGGSGFTASVLRAAIRDSMNLSLNRMGADLVVVPRETNVNLAAALLTVEPTERTLDAATVAFITRLPGVAIAAPQRYFALPSADGHGQQDLIAFDPGRDFTVMPWLSQRLDRPLRRGDVIVGGRRPEMPGGTAALYGRSLPVYGKLALTGVGPFERAYFVTFETAADIAAAARETTGKEAFDPSRDRVSALLVGLRVGATPEQIQFAAANLAEAQIVVGNGLNTSVRHALTSILDGWIVFTILILSTTALMVGAMYSGLIAERRRELGLLLAVGMRPAQVARLIVAEAALTTGLGGASGIILGGAALLAFERSIGFGFVSRQVPFMWPSATALFQMGAAAVLSCGVVGIGAALLPALQAIRCEPYALVRGEGA